MVHRRPLRRSFNEPHPFLGAYRLQCLHKTQHHSSLILLGWQRQNKTKDIRVSLFPTLFIGYVPFFKSYIIPGPRVFLFFLSSLLSSPLRTRGSFYSIFKHVPRYKLGHERRTDVPRSLNMGKEGTTKNQDRTWGCRVPLDFGLENGNRDDETMLSFG